MWNVCHISPCKLAVAIGTVRYYNYRINKTCDFNHSLLSDLLLWRINQPFLSSQNWEQCCSIKHVVMPVYSDLILNADWESISGLLSSVKLYNPGTSIDSVVLYAHVTMLNTSHCSPMRTCLIQNILVGYLKRCRYNYLFLIKHHSSCSLFHCLLRYCRLALNHSMPIQHSNNSNPVWGFRAE